MKMTEHEQKLRAWMEEYHLQRILREDESPPERWVPSLTFSEQPAPAEGQIRLWPATHNNDPPFYGFLLTGHYGTWKVLPFSSLSIPATPQEWACRERGPASVLQGWNRREVPSAKVQASWFAEDAAAELLLCVRIWWTALESGGPAPASLSPQLGPPLWHPADPRYEFLTAESERVDRSLGESLALRLEEPAAAWAAEDSTLYGTRCWEIGDSGDLWVVDAKGGWIKSSAGTDAWDAALLRSDAGEWTWNGQKLLIPHPDKQEWKDLLWRGHTFPLRIKERRL
jgi:hypothetical protein